MKSSYRAIGELVERVDVRNKDGTVEKLLGLSIDKKFIPSVANTIGTDLSTYKIIKRKEFAVSLMQVSRDAKIPVACQKEYDAAIMSPAYSIFRVKQQDEIMPDFLELWFKRSEFDREAAFIAVGGVRGSMPWDEFARIKVSVPTMDRQKEIVRQYKTIADRVALKRKINDHLVEILKLDYKKLIQGYNIDSANLPTGWIIGNIGNYCDVKSGYAFKSEWWTDTGYKVIKIANITNNTIDIDSCDCVAKEHTDKANNFFVQSGDVLIAMTGATTGKVGIVPYSNNPLVVNQRVGKFFLGDTPFERAPFLFSTLLSDNVSRQLRPNGTAGSAQDNLSPDDIKNIGIVFPEETTIERYNRRNVFCIRTLTVNCSEIMLLKKISNIILQRISN